ncbi:hypothetical protein E2C01_036293 [Portunus trituberculatus]|uniref:Uncharacterized protein n=1 Tax=Portunus trituberculatus TaxID=210409 RepID=A0A5B7FBJ2_PORTR|nr:hypothetical protein [Portunus trituberculatus]
MCVAKALNGTGTEAGGTGCLVEDKREEDDGKQNVDWPACATSRQDPPDTFLTCLVEGRRESRPVAPTAIRTAS